MNNRQASRRRGRGNNRPQGGNRNGFDHQNRIDNRARGNAAQMLEKYRKLANDAQMNGDRVQTEYYLQFADHYFRVLADFQSRQAARDGQQQGQHRWREAEREALGDGDMVDTSQGEEGDQDDRDGGERFERNEQRRQPPQRQFEERRPREASDGDSEGSEARERPRRRARAVPASDDRDTDVGIFDAAVLPPAIARGQEEVPAEASGERSADDADGPAAEAPAPRKRGRPRTRRPDSDETEPAAAE